MINIDEVREFAAIKHSGQVRKTGEPYVSHPIRVAEIVKHYKGLSKNLDVLVAAALLHDTLEDTDTSYKELKQRFGEDVASIVLEVTSAKIASKLFGKHNYLLHKMEDMTPYALTIKLADRLDNICDFVGCSQEFVEKYIAETEFILENLKNERKYGNAQEQLAKAIEEKLKELKKSFLK